MYNQFRKKNLNIEGVGRLPHHCDNRKAGLYFVYLKKRRKKDEKEENKAENVLSESNMKYITY